MNSQGMNPAEFVSAVAKASWERSLGEPCPRERVPSLTMLLAHIKRVDGPDKWPGVDTVADLEKAMIESYREWKAAPPDEEGKRPRMPVVDLIKDWQGHVFEGVPESPGTDLVFIPNQLVARDPDTKACVPAMFATLDESGCPEPVPYRQRGAHLSKRILHLGLASIRQACRYPGARFSWSPTVAELSSAMWGDGYRPDKHGADLGEAVRSLADFGFVTPSGGFWSIGLPRKRPNPRDPNDRAVIEFLMPDGKQGGVKARLGMLILAGQCSDVEYEDHA